MVQRTSSDLRLSPHLHVVFLDGAYRERDGELVWRELPRLTTTTSRTPSRRRIERHLRARRWTVPPCTPRPAPAPRTHDGADALLRYALRPAIPQERVDQRPDGLVRITLKRALAMAPSPSSWIRSRSSRATPPPKLHTVKYAGVLSSAHTWRARIAHWKPADQADAAPEPKRRGARRVWAESLARTLGIDVLECPKCSGRMRLVAMVTDPRSVRAYRRGIGEPCGVPERSPPHWESFVLRRNGFLLHGICVLSRERFTHTQHGSFRSERTPPLVEPPPPLAYVRGTMTTHALAAIGLLVCAALGCGSGEGDAAGTSSAGAAGTSSAGAAGTSGAGAAGTSGAGAAGTSGAGAAGTSGAGAAGTSSAGAAGTSGAGAAGTSGAGAAGTSSAGAAGTSGAGAAGTSGAGAAGSSSAGAAGTSSAGASGAGAGGGSAYPEIIVKATTGTIGDEQAMIAAGVALANATMKTACFRDFVLAAKWTETEGLTQAQIWQKLCSGPVSVSVEMYLGSAYQNYVTKTIGYEDEPGEVHMNRFFVDTAYEVASNIIHEAEGHTQGFSHYGVKSTSVPYGLNDAFEACAPGP